MIFAQEQYLDADGRSFPADQIGYVTTYRRLADGFFKWTCGHCPEEHSGRSFELPQGTVHRCDICGQMNLLLSSSSDYIREALAFWEANKPQIITGRFPEIGNKWREVDKALQTAVRSEIK